MLSSKHKRIMSVNTGGMLENSRTDMVQQKYKLDQTLLVVTDKDKPYQQIYIKPLIIDKSKLPDRPTWKEVAKKAAHLPKKLRIKEQREKERAE